jgi:hypothetical protein
LKRRLLLEIEVADTAPGATLDALLQITGLLEEMKSRDDIIDYGIGLEHNVTWFVRTAAQMIKDLEETEKTE